MLDQIHHSSSPYRWSIPFFQSISCGFKTENCHQLYYQLLIWKFPFIFQEAEIPVFSNLPKHTCLGSKIANSWEPCWILIKFCVQIVAVGEGNIINSFEENLGPKCG